MALISSIPETSQPEISSLKLLCAKRLLMDVTLGPKHQSPIRPYWASIAPLTPESESIQLFTASVRSEFVWMHGDAVGFNVGQLEGERVVGGRVGFRVGELVVGILVGGGDGSGVGSGVGPGVGGLV